jgi:L-asparagine transporter-like permease
MTTMLISGVIGIGMFMAFLGFLIVWVPAPPLIVIVCGVTALLIYDFIGELRSARNQPR